MVKAKFFISKVSYQIGTVYGQKSDGTTDYESGARSAEVMEVSMSAVKGSTGQPEDQFFGAATPNGQSHNECCKR